MNRIYARSPYFVNIDEGQDSTVLEVFVYQGIYSSTVMQGSQYQTGRLYTLNSTAIDGRCTFEISDIISSFFDQAIHTQTSSSSYTMNSQSSFVNFRYRNQTNDVISTYSDVVNSAVVNGYLDYEQGSQYYSSDSDVNYTKDYDRVLLDVDEIITYKNDNTTIPLSLESSDSINVYYMSNDDLAYPKQTISTTFYGSSNICTQIKNKVDNIDEFQFRVEGDGGVFLGREGISEDCVFESIEEVTDIYVSDSNGVHAIKVRSIDECRHKPYKISFINKHGAFQDLWFFKRSNTKITSKSESYKSNIVSDGVQDITRHQYKQYNRNGKETMTLNTGFYPESYNEVFKQLNLSERIWITKDNKVLPVSLKTSDIAFKTQLNDRLINYTMEIEFAYDKINSVR